METPHVGVLRGREVTLRPLTVDDAASLAAAAAESREEFALTWVPNSLGEARQYVEAALAQAEAGCRMPFAVEWNERVVGSTSYYFDAQPWRWPEGSPFQRSGCPDAVEIGSTWLAVSAQRTRCNTEAKYLLLRHAFDIWQVHRVSLKTDARNARSRRAIERLGAILEGVHRADMPAQDGSVRNSAYYSLLPSEWPEARHRLEAVLAR